MLVTGSQKGTVLKGTTFADTLLGWGVKLNADGSVTEDVYKVAHESMFGNSSNDKLYGGAGNDKLYGEVGDDLLYGGTGLDKLYGGSGNDKLYGGTGNDLLDGGIGADQLYGEGGDDQLYGGDGNDLLNGDSADFFPVDTLVALPPFIAVGNDTLYGGDGDDVINGDGGSYYPSGKELVIAGQFLAGGNDILYGGYGNDRITGGLGIDSLTGGLGNDTFVFYHGESTLTEMDIITDFVAADDTLELYNPYPQFSNGGDAFADFAAVKAAAEIFINSGYIGGTFVGGDGVNTWVISDTDDSFWEIGDTTIGPNDIVLQLIGTGLGLTAADII